MTPKLDPPVKKNAFVHKLYGMLNNPKLAHLIWWTGPDDSNTFALYPSKEFADALLDYFKHGNVASFVRQLHMYGFHKILDPQLAYHDKDLPIWEFRHLLGKFKKNDESLLVYIKRRLLLNLLRNSLVLENENSHRSYDRSYDQAPYHPKPQPYPYYYHPQWQVPVSVPFPGPPPHPNGMPNGTTSNPNPNPTPVPGPYPTEHYHPVILPPPTPKEKPASPSPKRQRRSHEEVSYQLAEPPLRCSHLTLLLPTYHEPARIEEPPHFRKPWDPPQDRRPRHPSLLFDPLAPSRNSEPIKLPPLGSSPPAQSIPPGTRPSLSSVPIRKSVYDKLRPLVIELHAAGHTGGLRTFDSMGLNLLLIFLAALSISSLLSGGRSSFGLISHLIEDRKPLLAPHEQPLPQMHPPGVLTILEERESSEHSSQPLQLLVSAEVPEATEATESSDSPKPHTPKPQTPLFKLKVLYLLEDSGTSDVKTETRDVGNQA